LEEHELDLQDQPYLLTVLSNWQDIPELASLLTDSDETRQQSPPDLFVETTQPVHFSRPLLLFSHDYQEIILLSAIRGDESQITPELYDDLHLTLTKGSFSAQWEGHIDEDLPLYLQHSEDISNAFSLDEQAGTFSEFSAFSAQSADNTSRLSRFVAGDVEQWLWMMGAALLAGLILNITPCVLPVLAIKLMPLARAGHHSHWMIRKGFLISAGGIMVAFLALAALLAVVKLAGWQIGWGMQFQSPLFLVITLIVVLLFAAVTLGWLDLPLPGAVYALEQKTAGKTPEKPPGKTQDSSASHSSASHWADFWGGFFACFLATTCSIPLIGTVTSFALGGNILSLLLVPIMGIGMALPYILVGLFPQTAQLIPKPGRWLRVVPFILASALLLTAVWLASLLRNHLTPQAFWGLTLFILMAFILLASARYVNRLRFARNLAFLCFVFAISAVLFWRSDLAPTQFTALSSDDTWQIFEASRITPLVENGMVVFIDITADWCVTCQVNKKLVLEDEEIVARLRAAHVVAMRGDMTLFNPEINNWLESHDRYAIPYYRVYGPNAPNGIALPDILNNEIVINALEQAL